MDIQPFVLREKPTDGIIQLLKSVTLGTNGARYRHLNTEERIAELDAPLFLSLEKTADKPLGNLTFCRRKGVWYIRYFAFDLSYQSKKNGAPSKGKGLLKQRISDVFDAAESGRLGEKVEQLFAYIDANNERSIWMSQNFGFQTKAKIASQTFSRMSPSKRVEVVRLALSESFRTLVNELFAQQMFYSDHYTFNAEPFYGVYEKQKLIGFCKTHRADWVIERLPGRTGGALVKLIPYVPGLRRILKPKSHTFLVIDTVWMKPGHEFKLQTMLESVLHEEKLNLMVWWVDQQDQLYQKVKNSVQWGVLHRLNGVSEVDVVVRSSSEKFDQLKNTVYVSGVDFI